MSNTLHLPQRLADAIRADAEETFPLECCGVLLGRDKPRVVSKIVPARNAAERTPERLFSIEPRQLLKIERDAAAEGLIVVGFYHSHPNGSALPSETDQAQAWPFYSYVIVAVSNGALVEVRSWRLLEPAGLFEPEQVVIEA